MVSEVFIFSTSIKNEDELELIKMEIENHPGIINWSVDLEDWEKILRIEGINIDPQLIVDILYSKRVFCREIT